MDFWKIVLQLNFCIQLIHLYSCYQIKILHRFRGWVLIIFDPVGFIEMHIDGRLLDCQYGIRRILCRIITDSR
jgi:hypothetical protein